MLGQLKLTRRRLAAPDSEQQEALSLLRTFEASNQGFFWSADDQGRLTYISETVAELLSITPTDMIGRRISDFFVADDDLSGRRNLPFVLSKQSPFSNVVLRPNIDSVERHWSVSGTPEFSSDGEFRGFRGSGIEVTEQRKSSAHASKLAQYDALTGLPNRRRMAETLESQLAGIEHHRRPCTVMLIDLDRFKQVNDTLGHPAGDALLKQVAERLTQIVKNEEQVFRLGGDEFQIIFPTCDDKDRVSTIASDIILSLSQPYSIEGSRCIIGCSIGIAVAPSDGTSRVTLIRNADLALYASKSEGRGCFRFFSKDLLDAAEERRALEEDLRDALARGELSLAYQPIVKAKTDCITGVEALLRWDHPIKGPISPGLFVPIAEEAGLINALGEWTLRKACEDAAQWPGDIRVAVNVSPIQFKEGSLPAKVLSSLAAANLAPERLELEITEGVFLADTPAADAMFASLKGIGVRLALDDFGTGYSSLGYLRSAPFDKIKIDQSFVREATVPGSRNGAIIAAIVALAEALEMETTAEGIEYMDQLDLIRRLRVSHVQGWIYSKALTSDELKERLNNGKLAITPSGPATERSPRQSVYRKVGLIHGCRYQSGIAKNLSGTGALLDVAEEVPMGAALIVDLGGGNLTYASVVRASGSQLAIKFDEELVSDGVGGLQTARKVSPYVVASLGLPGPGGEAKTLTDGHAPLTLDAVAKRLGLSRAGPRQAQAPISSLRWEPTSSLTSSPTFQELSKHYLDSIAEDECALEKAKVALTDYILPHFANQRLVDVKGSEIQSWISSLEADSSSSDEVSAKHIHKLLARMCSLAVDLKLVEAEQAPLISETRRGRTGGAYSSVGLNDARELLLAAKDNSNRQLKFILSLLMLTGARMREILNMRWTDVDLEAAIWRVPVAAGVDPRETHLNEATSRLLRMLPRVSASPYVLPNPSTKRPYRSLTQSWEAVKAKATLQHLDLDDLRYCEVDEPEWENLTALFEQ